MSQPKDSKKLTRKPHDLSGKMETGLVSQGGLKIEVRGLNFDEMTYAKSQARKLAPLISETELDEAAAEIILRQWVLRFGILAVQGQALPRQPLNIGIGVLQILPVETIAKLNEHPDIAEALYLGILGKSVNTAEEIERLDFTSLFGVTLAAGAGVAEAAQA